MMLFLSKFLWLLPPFGLSGIAGTIAMDLCHVDDAEAIAVCIIFADERMDVLLLVAPVVG
ncbi:MAG: hypothetical protein R6W75_02085 [Smithellaceae bacterium]